MSVPLPALERPAISATGRLVATGRAFAPYAPIAAAAIAIGAGLVAVNDLPVGGFFDDAFYVILGKALATGQGYRNLNLPAAPFATHYPPGYPLLLAALWRVWPSFPANVLLFKLANVVFLGVIAAFGYRLGRERMGFGVAGALVMTIAGTVTTPALYLSSMVLSETMFLALLLPFLLWAEGAMASGRPSMGTSLLLGAGSGLLFLVRSQSIALTAAIVVVYAVRRRWKESGAALAAAIVVASPWLIWVAVHDAAYPLLLRGDYGSYFAWFVDGIHARGPGMIVDAVRRNLPEMLEHLAKRLRPPSNPIPNAVTSLGVILLGVAGAARLSRRAPVTLAFVAAYLGLVAVWPFPPARFLLGIWILLMLVLVCGAQLLWEGAVPIASWRGARARLTLRLLGGVASCVLAAGAVAYNVRGYQRHWWATTEEQSARWVVPKVQWARANTENSAVIATDHDEGSVYLYTGRPTVPATTFTADEYFSPRDAAADAAILQTLTTHFDVRYVMLSGTRLRGAAAALSVTRAPLGDTARASAPWVFRLR